MLSLVSIDGAKADWDLGLRSGWRWEQGGTRIDAQDEARHAARLAPDASYRWRRGESTIRWRLAPALEAPDRGSLFSRIASDVAWTPGRLLQGWTLTAQIHRLQFDRPTRWVGRTRWRLAGQHVGALGRAAVTSRYHVDLVRYQRLPGAPVRDERRQAASLRLTSHVARGWVSTALTGRLAEASLDPYDRLGVELYGGAGWTRGASSLTVQGAREWRRYTGGDVWRLSWLSATLTHRVNDQLRVYLTGQRQIGSAEQDREVFRPWRMVEAGWSVQWPLKTRGSMRRLPSPLIPSVQQTRAGTIFRFHAPKAHSVHLVGSFSQWNQTRHPMGRTRDGTWQTTLSLASGVHEYAYLVDGRIWRAPEAAAAYADDGFGSRNGVLVITPKAEDE